MLKLFGGLLLTGGGLAAGLSAAGELARRLRDLMVWVGALGEMERAMAYSLPPLSHLLAELSGREHVVYSGVTVRQGGRAVTEHEATPVRFRPLTAEDIARYTATGEPMDKAGAYGIQGYGSLLVEGITGDYYNVMGLPVCRLGRILKSFGVDPLALAAEKEFVK